MNHKPRWPRWYSSALALAIVGPALVYTSLALGQTPPGNGEPLLGDAGTEATGDAIEELGFQEPALGSTWVFVLAALALGSAVVWQRRVQGLGTRKAENLRLIGSLPLGDKRAIALVQADGQRMLVGITQGQVNLLCQLEEQTHRTPMLPFATEPTESTTPPTSESFGSLLRLKLLKRPLGQ